MRLLAIALSLLSIFQLAAANTEAISFYHGSVNPGLGSVLSPGSAYRGEFTKDLHIRFGLDAKPGNYFTRVCWPASHPAEFTISYDSGFITIKANRNDVVGLNPNSYSDTVPFEVILSETWLGIPLDIFPTIVAVFIAAVTGVLGYSLILR